MDAAEGTESFASISAAVFELSRKSGRGGDIPPPSGARVNTQDMLEFYSFQHNLGLGFSLLILA